VRPWAIPRRTVNLQFVAIREDGVSESLPPTPDTLRVYLILQDAPQGARRGWRGPDRSDPGPTRLPVRFPRPRATPGG